MSTIIWEDITGYNSDSPLRKYTVVYENKTYYYCKQSGTDELSKFGKQGIQDNKRFLITNKEMTKDEIENVLKSRTSEERRLRLEREVRIAESSVQFTLNAAEREKSKLDAARKTLARYNAENPK